MQPTPRSTSRALLLIAAIAGLLGCGDDPPSVVLMDGGAPALDASGQPCWLSLDCGPGRVCVDDACVDADSVASDDLALGELRFAAGISGVARPLPRGSSVRMSARVDGRAVAAALAEYSDDSALCTAVVLDREVWSIQLNGVHGCAASFVEDGRVLVYEPDGREAYLVEAGRLVQEWSASALDGAGRARIPLHRAVLVDDGALLVPARAPDASGVLVPAVVRLNLDGTATRVQLATEPITSDVATTTELVRDSEGPRLLIARTNIHTSDSSLVSLSPDSGAEMTLFAASPESPDHWWFAQTSPTDWSAALLYPASDCRVPVVRSRVETATHEALSAGFCEALRGVLIPRMLVWRPHPSVEGIVVTNNYPEQSYIRFFESDGTVREDPVDLASDVVTASRESGRTLEGFTTGWLSGDDTDLVRLLSWERALSRR